MKKKIIAFLSVIMAFICVFTLVGCSTQQSSIVTVEEYFAAREKLNEVSIRDRNSERLVATTIVMDVSTRLQEEETLYYYDGDIEKSVKVKTREIEMKSVCTVSVEYINGVCKFNMSAVGYNNLVHRTIVSDTGEIEVDNEKTKIDEFYTLKYDGEEARLYRYDNLNSENNMYKTVYEEEIMDYVFFLIGTFDDFNNTANLGTSGAYLYRDGAYVGVKVAPYDENAITEDECITSYTSIAFDNKGNVKGETKIDCVCWDDYTFTEEKISISCSIKNGASFKSKKTDGIELGDFDFAFIGE